MARKIGSRYTAHQILGRGSAGTVWLGEGPEGPVAIKLLREDLASDQELVGRFVQERTALLGLEHPHIVTVRDLVVDGNDLALVMDLVRGTDLRTRLERERRLAPEAAVAIVADVADALAAAHAAGVVHRDVKPENVLLDMQGPLGPGGAHPALLTDFGVAKLIDAPRRTRATKIIGTPDYLAPEIVEGLPPRASVDIYALATVLYELLAGFTPFGGGHPGAVLRRHVTETVVPLPGIPEELWQLIVQCLAKAPASRLRASELAARLREQLPTLAGLPPLDVDEPDLSEEAAEEEPAAPAAPAGGEPVRRRGAVSLVQGSRPDSNRDTHTSMRVPAPDELAGGAHGTARAPRSAGAPRPGSAKHRAAVRRRRITLGVAGVAVAALVSAGAWWATSDSPQDTPPPASTSSTP
ncbi:serine/threonine-protein kinase [Streptomyces griseofuscus]|uniref:non-specific serine/threonine protein kinase n=2 Tax=Streptomyces TaxID=1883 RepID=A0A3R8QAW9_9ACTN|nr:MULTISPECIES: serine/threonine-protein kinase [Streptomyces]MBJ7001465.1 serine/threonine protein kinase [Streptomyces sp. CRPSP2-6A1]MYQ90452.1 protein kinase [Streptomyces sp. SID4946]RRQ79630.1 serine/threonine protein kinase [Streptomyces griseofuscus]RRQ84941.1 serine/threonine protein kinase [Streptomyces griseofuscus]SCF60306.1 serine/threonine protein kinase [Streptomyces sp. DconLS]